MGCILGKNKEEQAGKSHISRILMLTKSVNKSSGIRNTACNNRANKLRIGTRPTLISMLLEQGRRRAQSVKVANNNECSVRVPGKGHSSSLGRFGKRQRFTSKQQDLSAGKSSVCKIMLAPKPDICSATSTKQIQKDSFPVQNPPPPGINCSSFNPSKTLSPSADQNEYEEVILFTSSQQLCQQVISEKILHLKLQSSNSSQCKALCLFIFGCQGSSKGELSFELAHHSSSHPSSSCPRYFLIDVAALIVANIDARIAEYNLLKEQTLQVRKQQAATSNKPQTAINQIEIDSISNESSGANQAGDRNLSICSNISEIQEDETENTHSVEEDTNLPREFAQVTLNTKQRSILQLKMVKYFNSVTSRWIISLIHKEIQRLEQESSINELQTCKSIGIFLVNLIPDQLSLFKSCLYLEQSLSLKEFEYPYYAIKFEKTTSIKLMRKEREPPNESNPNHPIEIHPKHFFNFGNLKLSVTKRSASSSEQLQVAARKAEQEHVNQHLAVNAASVLTRGITDKLDPKYTEHFVQQFRSLNKLLRVRYNPKHDYNYASAEDEYQQSRDIKSPSPTISRSGCSSNSFFLESPTEIEQSRRISLTRISPSAQALGSSSRHQLSPTPSLATRAGSITSSAFTCADESDVSSCQSYQTLAKQQVATIKWAVELHLFHSNHSKKLDEDDTEVSSIIKPKSGRSGSSSSVGSNIIIQNTSTVGKNQFALVPARIAYANGQTQVKYEVKQVNKRSIKLKSQSDAMKIVNRLAKAKLQISRACEEWLFDTLDIRGRREDKVYLDSTKRHLFNSNHSSSSANSRRHIPVINLVVHRINVDITRLIQEPNEFASSSHRLPLVTTTLASDGLQLPKSTMQPQQIQSPILVVNNSNKRLSDSSDLIGKSREKLPRRVQFKLREAPTRFDEYSEHKFDSLKIEKRHWLEDNVFISAFADDELSCQMIFNLATLLNSIKR